MATYQTKITAVLAKDPNNAEMLYNLGVISDTANKLDAAEGYYKKAIEIMNEVIPYFKSHYTSFLFPDFVGLYGHDDFNTSIQALKYFTQFGSSEFAIREFLKRNFNKTIKVMYKWAEDENHHGPEEERAGRRYDRRRRQRCSGA